jgi:ABC-type multidrug transport system ATPase subunit
MRWSGKRIASQAPLSRAVPVDVLFGAKTKLTIGRAPDCDVCLPHPTVSRCHALLERVPEGLRLHDLNSVNGVLIGGRRIEEPIFLQERERVGIGPFLFSLAGGVIYSLDSSQSLRLEARNLEKVVRLDTGQTRKLLDNINVVIEPGEFVGLLGPSGSGKSTLMDCLNGRRPATGGRVLANGEDFYQHFNSFRQSLGYVPQRDIVHTQLTVYRALYYTAQLRLPVDTTPSELATRIEEVVKMMELEPHRNTLVANLSGGQVKRVSLGAELLARPCLLYIDEATSGLDAGTEARMMRLFRQLSDEGKSVICITHNVDNVDRCNLIIVLARGKLVFFGPPPEALTYFGVHRLGEVYDRLAEKEAEAWERAFAACSLHQEFVQKRLEASPANAEPTAEGEKRKLEAPLAALRSLLPELPSLRSAAATDASERPYHPPLWHQFRVLTTRYAELTWGDRRSLRLLLLQAPIVALFILLGFIHKGYQQKVLAPRKLTEGERNALEAVRDVNERADPTGKAKELLDSLLPFEILEEMPQGDWSQKSKELLTGLLKADGPVVPDKLIVDPRYTYMLLFILAVTVLWFGCNNAAKEIVKEEAIYGRERAVNLGILPYLASKFLVLSIVSAVQALLVMLAIYGVLQLFHVIGGDQVPYAGYRLAYVPQFGVLVLLAMTGVALGLLLSACVSTPDRANSLLPYVLIPQIILGGGIMPVNSGILFGIAFLASPVYWAYRGIRRGATTLPTDLPVHMDYNDSVWIVCVALLVQTVALLLATAWFLRQKDVRRA